MGGGCGKLPYKVSERRRCSPPPPPSPQALSSADNAEATARHGELRSWLLSLSVGEADAASYEARLHARGLTTLSSLKGLGGGAEGLLSLGVRRGHANLFADRLGLPRLARALPPIEWAFGERKRRRGGPASLELPADEELPIFRFVEEEARDGDEGRREGRTEGKGKVEGEEFDFSSKKKKSKGEQGAEKKGKGEEEGFDFGGAKKKKNKVEVADEGEGEAESFDFGVVKKKCACPMQNVVEEG